MVESRQDMMARNGVTGISLVPKVYSLTLNTGVRKIHYHNVFKVGSTVSEQDLDSREALMMFAEEDMANRIAKAMLHAMELCGAGSKDPF